MAKDFDSGMPPPNPNLTCRFCGEEIAPDTCWCGDSMGHGSMSAGHSPVPMGCLCWSDNNVKVQQTPYEKLKEQLESGHIYFPSSDLRERPVLTTDCALALSYALTGKHDRDS